MADSFFKFDTTLSNLNDDDGGGGDGSEDEYDALNDETFGMADEFDWEVEHEQLANELESSRRNKSMDDSHSQLEASLSQLVLDETDAPHSSSFTNSVWQHDPNTFPIVPKPKVPALQNVCTVEELERQMRQKQQHQNIQHNQNYYQPRFPPVILQRPPGLQAPVPLPFAPQPSMTHNMGQMNQQINSIMGQNAPMGHSNQMGPIGNQMGQGANQMGQMGGPMNQMLGQFMQNSNIQSSQFQNSNQNMPTAQLMQNMNQMPSQTSHNMPNLNQMGQGNQMMSKMGQPMNQMGQVINQMPPNMNQMSQGLNQTVNSMGQGVNQMGQNMNQMGQDVTRMGQDVNRMGQDVNRMGQNVNHMGHGVNQIGQSVSQMGQGVNQMMPNGNQFGPGMNQFQHMMSQSRMIAPPPGLNMPQQNFSPNMGQFNHTFRGPTVNPSKPLDQQPMSQNMVVNQTSVVANQNYQQKNHSPQAAAQKQTSPQNPKNGQKMPQQKNRVIYNSNQKNMTPQNMTSQNITTQNMTSQNLVQLIQNTHPMLQFNNSFHNANHHPILNNRNNMFGNNVVNHPMFDNQRTNGGFSNNRHQMNGGDDCSINGISSSSDGDEYAGLMTQREKQWLINIQMLQLNTGTPYIDDFYYTVFLERQSQKEKEGVKEAHKANQQNHPFYSGAVKQEQQQRERHNSQRHNSQSEDVTPRTYVPTQFENSLGKLQCGSVTAPRKIIDVELVQSEGGNPGSERPSRAPSVASTTNPAEMPREMRRTKQVLLDIEALYLILMRLEEMNDPLAISNALILKEREEKQKLNEIAQKELQDKEDESNVFLRNIESVQRKTKNDSAKSEIVDKRQVVNLSLNQNPAPTVKNLLDENKDELINKMFSGLLHEDRLQQVVMVRKGRAMLARFVSKVPPTHSHSRALWSRVLRCVSAVARRDDAAFVPLTKHYMRYIQHSNGWAAILESCSLLSEALDPARTPYALTTPFTLSCVSALVEKASTLVNTPEATANERQWSKFLKTLARTLKNTRVRVARPTLRVAEPKLAFHIKQLESRSTIEILQRGKTAAEFADLSKSDFSTQLIAHLC